MVGSNPKCWNYEPIDIDETATCINCHHWGGKKCKDEALLLAEWDREHGVYDYIMKDNKGVRIDG